MNGQDSSKSTAELSQTQRETARYTADIVLQLGHTASQVQLSFLAHLLDMTYYEAYRLGHGVEPDLAEVERQRQARETS